SASVDWAGVIVTFKSRAMHWIAGSAGIFSANGNWSWSKGGTSNGSNPGNNDDVIFDNGGLGNCTTTSAVLVNSLDLQSTYTGTVTAGAGGSDRVRTVMDITVSGGSLGAGGGAFRTNLSPGNNYLGNFVITGGSLDGAGAAIQGVDLIVSGGAL